MLIFFNFNSNQFQGIIGGQFGTDANIVNYLQNKVFDTKWELEIANHGYNHEDFASFTLEQQIKLMNDSNNQILSKLPIKRPVTFIPPFNSFNEFTFEAAWINNFTVVSSQVELDPGPYNLTGKKILVGGISDVSKRKHSLSISYWSCY